MKINDIFESINGEVSYWGQGKVTTFIRFSGCNMSCLYCDTDHSHYTEMSLDEVLDKIAGSSNITLTGGEPLLYQDAIIQIITGMPKATFTIETNGSIDPSFLMFARDRISIVADFKGDLRTNLSSVAIMHEIEFRKKILQRLNDQDFVKIIIKNDDDITDAYWWIGTQMRWMQNHCDKMARFAVSPILKKTPEYADGPAYYTDVDMKALVNVFRKTPVFVNIQLHKFIGLK